jgi:phytoene synthase
MDTFTLNDELACRQLLRGGSKTFLAASHLLPARVRNAACALYAFCRVADDAVDLSEQKDAAVGALQDRLQAIYGNGPLDHPADRAMRAVTQRYGIPRALPAALLEGFAWDAQFRQYETLDDLHDYGARVAGTVGAMMALILGVRSAQGLARATDLGCAMQLSNIARDVGEDAREGRLFLPKRWMREEGIDPDAFLAEPVFSPALGRVVERLLQEADRLYRQVDQGLHWIPSNARTGILAARLLYAEIGEEVRRRRHDSVSQRAVVSASQKAKGLASAVRQARLIRRPATSQGRELPGLSGCEFLITACVTSEAPSRFPAWLGYVPWWRQKGRAEWMLELFDQVEQRRQKVRAPYTTTLTDPRSELA